MSTPTVFIPDGMVGYIRFYSGAAPADPFSPPTGALLMEIVSPSAAWNDLVASIWHLRYRGLDDAL